jgi:hypothetical protein
MGTVWYFLVNNSEGIALWASIVAALAGLVALVVVWRRWAWLEKHYQEWWAKTAVAFFRAVAALSAIAAKPAPLDPNKSPWEQPWAPTIAIAAAGYLFWEIAGAKGDQKYKRSKEKTAADHQKAIEDLNAAHQTQLDALNQAHEAALAEASEQAEQATQDREDAEYHSMRLGWLLTHLRGLVQAKRQRLREVTEGLGPGRTIQHARDGLAPAEQVQILLEWLASLFRMQAMNEDGSRHNQNFRVGLFAEREGRLVPLAAFDLVTRSHAPFSSYEQHVDRYRLDTTAPSLAVRCVVAGQTLIVPDCAAVPGFFFHARQANYLRSMVARPLANFCEDGITPTRAALLIDTDVAGFFQEDDREMLEILLTEFVARIDLEYAIGGLTG